MNSQTQELRNLFINYPLFFFAFISKHYPLTESQIDYLSDELFWMLIATNEEIEFTIPIIEKHIDKLCKESLGFNLKVNENPALLTHFNLKPRSFWCKEYDIDESTSDLPLDSDYHPAIRYHRYSLTEIEENKHKISWNHFSSNRLIKWDYDLIYKYKDFLWLGVNDDPNVLSTDALELYNNEAVPWDLEVVKLFADKILNHKPVVGQFVNNETLAKNLKPLMTQELFLNVVSRLT